jgi:signal transduction histidine kinase
MIRVLDCIAVDHDLRFVVVAGLICLFGAFTGVSLLSRALRAERRVAQLWVAAAALIGGGTVWATHFVAMLAYRHDVPFAYDISLTVLSIAVAVGMTWLGYIVAAGGGRMAALGGLVAGLAVALMHYTGIRAIQGPFQTEWSATYVAASIVLSAALATASFHVLARRPPSDSARIGAALLLSLAIVSLHFTGMSAMTIILDPTAAASPRAADPGSLVIAVVAVTVLIIGAGLTGSMVDRHLADRSMREAETLRATVDELSNTKAELERATETLRVALEHAAASSQAKSQFLASMSHELRTPLNAIIGFSGMISNEILGPIGNRRYLEYAETIGSSGNHLLSLINEILDLSSLNAGALRLREEVVDLAAVTHEAVRMVANQALGAGVTVVAKLPPLLPRVVADRRRLRQVILNLLSNAVKFTPADGSVLIAAAVTDRGVSLSVTDTGIGIENRDIPRVFERFGQVENAHTRGHEGTGLGLPLSRDLIELHGGTLDLRSVVGIGTCVTITLPRGRIVSDAAVPPVAPVADVA